MMSGQDKAESRQKPGKGRKGDKLCEDFPMALQRTRELLSNEDFQRLQPIAALSPVLGIRREAPPHKLDICHTDNHLVSNSAVIYILVHLLCRERENDPGRRDQLFKAISKVIEQYNSSLCLPLHTLPHLQDFKETLLPRFEFLFEQAKTHIGTNGASLSLTSLHHIPSPLTQLRLTTAEELYLERDDRYAREFEEIKVIGRGGFGIVTKVRNRLDGHLYAVKLIPINRKNGTKAQNVLREVQSLAQLDHPNIVRYHSTWMQSYHRPSHHQPPSSVAKEDIYGRMRMSLTPSMYPLQPKGCAEITEMSSASEDEDITEASDGIVFADGSQRDDIANVGKPGSGCRLRNPRNNNTSNITSNMNSSLSIKHSKLKENASDIASSMNIFQNYIKELEVQSKSLFSVSESAYSAYSNASTSSSSSESLSKLDVLSSTSSLSLDISSTGNTFGQPKSISSLDLSGTNSVVFDLDQNVNLDSESIRKKKPLVLYHPPRKRLARQRSSGVPRPYLFIQMGLCDESLQDWLRCRNSSALCLEEGVYGVDAKLCLALFKQILEAVEFIHSFNIIHRDIKPANIFFTKGGKQIQVGDFGLSRKITGKLSNVNEESSSSSSLLSTFSEHSADSSGAIGTPLYAAPELKAGGRYGVESDLHSLGIILLELFQPFQTVSERIHSIEALKEKRQFDEDLKKSWPNVVPWILKLTEQNPKERPSASEVLISSLYTFTTSEESFHFTYKQNDVNVQEHLYISQSNHYSHMKTKEISSSESSRNVFSSEARKAFDSDEPQAHSQQEERQPAEDCSKDMIIAQLKEENSQLSELVARLQRQVEELQLDSKKASDFDGSYL